MSPRTDSHGMVDMVDAPPGGTTVPGRAAVPEREAVAEAEARVTAGAAPGSDEATERWAHRAVRHHEVVIVGGGTAGVSVAARLCRGLADPDVAIVEPSGTHYYQPLWTLTGAGVLPKERSARPQADVIPARASWVQASVVRLDPDADRVLTDRGEWIGYDLLIVACGIELWWEAIAGLAGNVGRAGICSNYAYDQCERTWETIRAFEGGTALFTMPPPPIKCAGAPQKIMYLADDAFRKRGVRERARIVYAAATPSIFPVAEYAKPLERVIARKGIETRYEHELVAVDAERKEATFIDHRSGERVALRYDMLHVVPPQRAPAVVRESPLADAAGWLEVDPATLRSPRYPNVLALGDACSAPTSKTGAAIRKQAPVAAGNALAILRGDGAERLSAYDGYTACPLVTGYGKLVLAEFDYDKRPAPSFPFDQAKERWSMYQLKRHGLPAYYWRRMLKGRG